MIVHLLPGFNVQLTWLLTYQVRKSSSPKRKRASLDASQLEQRQPADENEADLEENPRPKKRGRPRKSIDAEQEGPVEPTKPKKRGRPSSGNAAASAPAQVKKKRGRPSINKEQNDQGTGKTTGRRKGHQQAAEEAQDEPQPAKPGRKKKSRVSIAQQEEEDQQEPPKKRKRGRPSLKDAAPSDANAETSKSTKGKATTSSGATRQPAGKRRSMEQPVEEEEPTETSRRISGQMALVDDEAPPKPRWLPHITSKSTAVKQSTIDAKWGPLTGPSINAANETLTLAHRPIMQRMSNSQARRQHTSSALALLHRRISRKLQRGLPFPPPTAVPVSGKGRKRSGHEAELDFESVLDGTAALERQLDPALHAVELLKREKEKMEEELERDYQTLRNLEAGARGEGRQRRERLKKMHVLAPEKREERDGGDFVFDKGAGVPPGMVFQVCS